MSYLTRENKQKDEKSASSSTTLAAAALQDQLVRSLNLGGMSRPFGPRKIGLGPAAKAQQLQKKNIRSTIDTGRNRKLKPKSDSLPKEYVLDPKAAPLTLAQKMGLVDAPEQPLTEEAWKHAKLKSNTREDSKQPCVICKEDFGTQQQVLLSCTHVFHRACLQAFERFTGKKTCPMCRREQYQTRVIHEGAKEYTIKSATRIQAAWRGYVVRKWYLEFRELHPPKDPKLRQKFYEEKLSKITDRIVKSCDFNLNTFLTEIDQSLEASRNIFKEFDESYHILSEDEWDEIQLKAIQREEQDCPICLTFLQSTTYMYLDSFRTPESAANTSKISSEGASRPKSKSKCESHKQMGDTLTVTHKDTKTRCTVLLSCTHVFHETCLQTFEDLVVDDGKHVCPVCRTVYQKKLLNI